MKVIGPVGQDGDTRVMSLHCTIELEVPADKRDELEKPEAVQMAVQAATAQIGPCRIQDKLTIIPYTAKGPLNTLPTAAEMKENPVISYRRGFKCHQIA